MKFPKILWLTTPQPITPRLIVYGVSEDAKPEVLDKYFPGRIAPHSK